MPQPQMKCSEYSWATKWNLGANSSKNMRWKCAIWTFDGLTIYGSQPDGQLPLVESWQAKVASQQEVFPVLFVVAST
jgi:hypothetical protein